MVPPLPRKTRFAAILLMIVAGLVGIYSAEEVMVFSHPSALADVPTQSYGALDGESAHKFNQVLVGTLTSMHDSRTLVLALLAVASALAFVAAGRLLRPAGISRESLRKLLAGSALSAAVLRTIDGAQMAVAYRRAFGAVADTFVRVAAPPANVSPDDLKALIAPLSTAFVMGWTLLLVGVFIFTAQHFRSQKVREFVAQSDAAQDAR